jgi:Leucine-rich repeat (LRR) protein
MPRERETADPPEAESDALQEMFDLTEDIRRKRNTFATTASNKSSTAGMPHDFLTDDEKVGLAVRTSVASITGAYRGQDQRRLPKPSQEELLEKARLGVKEGSRRPQPDTGPQLSSAELRPIDDLQDRMNDFQLCVVIKDLDEKHGQRQRRSRKFWAAIAAFTVIIIGGVVVGTTLGLLGGKGRNDVEPGSLPTASAFDVNSCYSRSDELSERYDSFRSVVVSLFPDMANAIDTSYSSASVALCWVSDFDKFELQIPAEGNDLELIQRFVLTAVYYHFEGTIETVTRNRFSKQNWLSGLHMCKWGFVECYNTGEEQNEVTGLSVGSVGSTGRIPTELAMLKNLLHLEFVQNLLTGSIPSQLGLLTRLDNLDLHNNELTGSIPSQLGLLTRLDNLNLRNNKLTGSIPSQLSLLARLDNLDLRNNEITGSIPSQLSLLTRLDNLVLYNNELTGSIPSELGLLTQLELAVLVLSYNQLTGSIPSELGLLTQLTVLSLDFILLSGTIPSELGLLTQLMLLDLSYNQLTGSISSELGLLNQLARLTLTLNQVTGSIPSELGLLKQLTALDLNGNQIMGSIPSKLGLLTQLTTLNLGSNVLTGLIPSELGLLTQLTRLNLVSNKLTGSMPPPLCSSVEARVYIDCKEIACSCCAAGLGNSC